MNVHLGFMDTELTAGVQAPKISPEDVAAQILQALVDGDDELLADDTSRQVKAGLSARPGVYLGTAG